METHLKFKTGQQRLFINKIIQSSKLNINQLAHFVSVSPRNFRDWRNEKLNITKSAVEKLSKKYKVSIPEKIEALERRWRENRAEKGRIGGLIFKKLYGNPGTTEGRIKGGKHAIKVLREKGIVPPVKLFEYPAYSKRLAEFVGIMLGDGGITPLQIQITLNSIADKEYLSFVTRLCSDLFNIEAKTFKKRGCNANVIYYNGINLVEFLKSIGLKIGNKVRLQVDVPDWVKYDKNYSAACLRGLIDTDGCIAIHKYKINGKEYAYKKLIFTNCSAPLAEFVYKTLTEFGFHPKMVKILEKRRVWLYNTNEARRYLNIIGSSNQRLNKFR